MPVLMALRERLADERPLEGQRIAGCVHLTKETAALVRTLLAAGAEVSWTGGNAITTQDDVAAALLDDCVRVFAWKGMSKPELEWAIDETLRAHGAWPTLLVDDGGDLLARVHTAFPEVASTALGATDKTSSGVQRMRLLAARGQLLFPLLAVNDVVTKWTYDNTYGTGQSVIDGILRATNVLLAGKIFVVGGFGHVGRGIALRARGAGSRVIVTCTRATTALRALREGFGVSSMDDAASVGEIFCTATGTADIIVGRHIDRMKDGVILCNAGHSDTEINLTDLDARTSRRECVHEHVDRLVLADGRRVFLLCGGGLVNLGAAEGSPSEVMDLSFANQVLGLIRIARAGRKLPPGVYEPPDAQDQEIAQLKLETMGVTLDELTDDQHAYLVGYEEGT